MRWLLLSVLLVGTAGCDSGGPDYAGPADYAFTLETGCFCVPAGPVRVTVLDGTVVDARPLRADAPDLDYIATSLTLAELSALAQRAEREADRVEVQYDRTYGFPTELFIDWDEDIADEEIRYTVTDYTLR